MQFHIGEAVAALRAARGPFDVIFNDIDKQGYPDALPVIEEKLRSGGVLIADNLLWSGRIFDQADQSPATDGVRKFTQMVSESAGWDSSLIPIRDGLMIARRS